MNGCLSYSGNSDRAIDRVAIRDGVDEVGLAMYERERDVVRGQYIVVVKAARELPGLLVESVSHVPEPWIVDDFGQVYHRKVDSSLRDEGHVLSRVTFGLNLTCGVLIGTEIKTNCGGPTAIRTRVPSSGG